MRPHSTCVLCGEKIDSEELSHFDYHKKEAKHMKCYWLTTLSREQLIEEIIRIWKFHSSEERRMNKQSFKELHHCCGQTEFPPYEHASCKICYKADYEVYEHCYNKEPKYENCPYQSSGETTNE